MDRFWKGLVQIIGISFVVAVILDFLELAVSRGIVSESVGGVITLIVLVGSGILLGRRFYDKIG